MAKDFVEPTIQKVTTSPKLTKADAVVEEAVVAGPAPDLTQAPKVKLPDFEEEHRSLSVSEMLNFSKDEVSNVFIVTIQKYADVLAGRVSCDDPKRVQSSFMNTVYRTLDLDFDKFCVVTDHLVNCMIKDSEAFSDINLFSLMPYIGNEYSKAQRGRYRSYILALATLARAGKNRRNIGQFIDIPTLVAEFEDKAKNNVNSYFIRAFRL